MLFLLGDLLPVFEHQLLYLKILMKIFVLMVGSIFINANSEQ